MSIAGICSSSKPPRRLLSPANLGAQSRLTKGGNLLLAEVEENRLLETT